MFIGREIELAQLEGAYSESGFKFFAVQGRRGIGKTALIEEFCRNKPAIFFSPVFGDGKANLTHISRGAFSIITTMRNTPRFSTGRTR